MRYIKLNCNLYFNIFTCCYLISFANLESKYFFMSSLQRNIASGKSEHQTWSSRRLLSFMYALFMHSFYLESTEESELDNFYFQPQLLNQFSSLHMKNFYTQCCDYTKRMLSAGGNMFMRCDEERNGEGKCGGRTASRQSLTVLNEARHKPSKDGLTVHPPHKHQTIKYLHCQSPQPAGICKHSAAFHKHICVGRGGPELLLGEETQIMIN